MIDSESIDMPDILYSHRLADKRNVFITFEIWIFFLQKMHGFATGGLYSRPARM